jgi:hypothetical protein
MDSCATALYQNDQHDDSEHASNNSDDRDIIQVSSPFFY